MNKVDIKKIEDVEIFEVPLFSDERGFFFESFKKKNLWKIL